MSTGIVMSTVQDYRNYALRFANLSAKKMRECNCTDEALLELEQELIVFYAALDEKYEDDTDADVDSRYGASLIGSLAVRARSILLRAQLMRVRVPE